MRYFYDPLFNYFRKLVVFFAVVTCAVSVSWFHMVTDSLRVSVSLI